jgi:hypothetical protein
LEGVIVEEAFLTIEQQTVYQVDPIQIRVKGREAFKVHRIEVVAKVPHFADPFDNGAAAARETKEDLALQPNGKITFFGRCTNNDGRWHWGDCLEYEDSFTMDIRVAGRFETDRSGLGRHGYTIMGVTNGALYRLDADEKFFFFNGPPTTTVGPHSIDCPYRLVINTKHENELVQAISMEPIYKPATDGEVQR